MSLGSLRYFLLINVIISLNIAGTSREGEREGDRERQLVYVTQISNDRNVPRPLLPPFLALLPFSLAQDRRHSLGFIWIFWLRSQKINNNNEKKNSNNNNNNREITEVKEKQKKEKRHTDNSRSGLLREFAPPPDSPPLPQTGMFLC